MVAEVKQQLTQIKSSYRDFLIEWNYKFPIDRWWREKYKVALFSEEHLNQSQLDIALEYYEEILFVEFREKGEILRQKEKEYEKGIWIGAPKITSEEEEDLFSKLDVMKINETGGKLQFEK